MVATEEYGRRLMPQILQEEARRNPSRLYAVIPRTQDLKDGFRDVSFAEMSHAVDELAHLMKRELGGPTTSFETLTYVGLSDARYNAVFYAAVKLGYKVFLPSPRNPASVNALLMQTLSSLKIVHSLEMEKTAEALRAQDPKSKTLKIPTLESLLDARPEPFPYAPSSFEKAKDHPILVLHSSGSTGTPKPVIMTHGTFATVDNDRNFPLVPGRRNQDSTIWDFGEKGRIYDAFPPFHLAGFLNKIMLPVFTMTAPVFGPALRPPSGSLTADILRLQKVRGAMLPPIVAEQLYHEPGGFDLLKKLDVLIFAGGPLSQVVGDELAKYTTLCQFYGSTEVGQVRQLVPRRDDWSYIEFHPSSKFELQPIDEAFELVIFTDDETADSSALYHNYPGTKEWRTKDLFEPHPTKANLWRFHARRDDIIVLSNGQKLNPIPFETALSTATSVAGAVVVGQSRPYPILIVELKDSHKLGADALQSVWPAIEEANKLMPTFGRVTRSSVIFATFNKPFARAGKGTVIRKQTEALYSDEIDIAYSRERTAPKLSVPSLQATFTRTSVQGLLRALIAQVVPEANLEDDSNLYMDGFDSRATMEVAENLKASLGQYHSISNLSWLSVDFFYNNPTIEQLTSRLLEFLNEGIVPMRKSRITEMQTTIGIHSKGLAAHKGAKAAATTATDLDSLRIAITGTTGYLGSRLLLKLSQNPRISEIFCLNRSLEAKTKWEQFSEANSATTCAKISFIKVDFGAPLLGLQTVNYHDILNCDAIIHNAWKVDFNLSLSSFEDNLKSVRSVIDLSLASPRKLRILFVSSVAATGVWSSSETNLVVPEGYVEDLAQSLPIGYGESKMVAEHVLNIAFQQAGVPVTILRVGQVAASTNIKDSKWPSTDFVPALLKTTKQLRLVPQDLSPVQWIPVDQLSLVIQEIMEHDILEIGPCSIRYYNVVNPCCTAWTDMIPTIQVWCNEDTRPVPLAEWLRELKRQDSLETKNRNTWPALRMLHFIDLITHRGEWATWEMKQAQRASKTLASLKPIGSKLIAQWLDQL